MSASSQHVTYSWSDKIPIWLSKTILNYWPPFLGTGIRVKTISADFRHIVVIMKMHWYNKNYVGTHFGGSMCAMTDAFYMLMLIKNLGNNYIVWDKATYIDFKKPGRGTLKAVFDFTGDEIAAIRQQADSNEHYIFDRPVDIINAEGVVVASVMKTLYVRKRK